MPTTYRLVLHGEPLAPGDECCSKERYGTPMESWFQPAMTRPFSHERSKHFIYRRPVETPAVSPAPQWFSVKERPPTEEEKQSGCVSVREVEAETVTSLAWHDDAFVWMPIPAVPKHSPDTEAFKAECRELGLNPTLNALTVWQAALAYARGAKP